MRKFYIEGAGDQFMVQYVIVIDGCAIDAELLDEGK